MITYHVESFASAYEEAKPLIFNHWEEIALNKDNIALSPDFEAYQNLEDQGRLHIYTAREGDKLVGYFAVIAIEHLHYKDHIFAHNDVIYVDPEYRRGFTAWRLIKFAEQQLTLSGVSVMMINIKRHKPFDKLLQRLNFKETESIYSKRLGVT